MTADREFATAREAANDPRILVFGRLLGAANRLEFLLGRALAEGTRLSDSRSERVEWLRTGDVARPVTPPVPIDRHRAAARAGVTTTWSDPKATGDHVRPLRPLRSSGRDTSA